MVSVIWAKTKFFVFYFYRLGWKKIITGGIFKSWMLHASSLFTFYHVLDIFSFIHRKRNWWFSPKLDPDYNPTIKYWITRQVYLACRQLFRQCSMSGESCDAHSASCRSRQGHSLLTNDKKPQFPATAPDRVCSDFLHYRQTGGNYWREEEAISTSCHAATPQFPPVCLPNSR